LSTAEIRRTIAARLDHRPMPRVISAPESTRSPLSNRVLVGTSGFGYTEWRGSFYPQELPTKKFLAYYAQHFHTTEVNNTFYRIPTRALTQTWYSEVPEDFRFTLKLSQEITHRRKLKNVGAEMQRFLDGAAALNEKLAIVLVQLAPFFRKETETLAQFLNDFSASAEFAFEFRHASWFSDDIYELLKAHQCALAVVEKEEGEGADSPRLVTGPFVYMRLRKGDYSKAELGEWAKWIRSQRANVYCYLKHDEKAPLLAREMLEALRET
jgi:uncharacterized protein YecE (DUF72 family)